MELCSTTREILESSYHFWYVIDLQSNTPNGELKQTAWKSIPCFIDPVGIGKYCHNKFSLMREQTGLGTSRTSENKWNSEYFSNALDYTELGIFSKLQLP